MTNVNDNSIERAAEMYQAGRDWAQSLKPGDTFLGSHGEAWARGMADWDAKFFGVGALHIIQTKTIRTVGDTNIIHSIEDQ